MSQSFDVTPSDDRELAIGRILDCTPEAAFRCWTEPALIVQWFTPPPFKTIAAQSDVRAGGSSVITMQAPDGTTIPNRGVYLEVVPNRKLVFTDAFVDAWTPSPKPMFTGVLTFEPEGEGRCRYTARARHWTAEDKAQHEAMGFTTGWGIAADQLEAVAKAL